MSHFFVRSPPRPRATSCEIRRSQRGKKSLIICCAIFYRRALKLIVCTQTLRSAVGKKNVFIPTSEEAEAVKWRDDSSCRAEINSKLHMWRPKPFSALKGLEKVIETVMLGAVSQRERKLKAISIIHSVSSIHNEPLDCIDDTIFTSPPRMTLVWINSRVSFFMMSDGERRRLEGDKKFNWLSKHHECESV